MGGLRREAVQCAVLCCAVLRGNLWILLLPPTLYQQIYRTHLHVGSTSSSAERKLMEVALTFSRHLACTWHGSRKFEYTSNVGLQVYHILDIQLVIKILTMKCLMTPYGLQTPGVITQFIILDISGWRILYKTELNCRMYGRFNVGR